MQIVIEISSYDKEWITNGYYIPEEINMRISEAIANGTSLPKGHGRLGDLDILRAKIFNASIDEHFMPVKSLTCDDVTDIIDDAPTIIVADTESEVQQ